MELIPEYKCLWLKDFFEQGVLCGITLDVVFSNDARHLNNVFSQLGYSPELIWMRQIHSADVRIAKRKGEYDCDGIFSSAGNKLMIVKTADCLPLIFHSKKLKVSGLIHMGWRSAAKGILNNIPYGLKSFKVVLGPGLRKCCYQVGEEFSRFPLLKDYLQPAGDKLYFDPVGFVKENLAAKGMDEDNIFDINMCSFCSRTDLFSYRKTFTDKRNLSFVFH
ncbi:MAG: hypothetical protein GF375_05725 [Candidatus Omnitrophica bacterium]|nr:hypothetical protein [Candidatus Omnitrophota bacterium]